MNTMLNELPQEWERSIYSLFLTRLILLKIGCKKRMRAFIYIIFIHKLQLVDLLKLKLCDLKILFDSSHQFIV